MDFRKILEEALKGMTPEQQEQHAQDARQELDTLLADMPFVEKEMAGRMLIMTSPYEYGAMRAVASGDPTVIRGAILCLLSEVIYLVGTRIQVDPIKFPRGTGIPYREAVYKHLHQSLMVLAQEHGVPFVNPDAPTT